MSLRLSSVVPDHCRDPAPEQGAWWPEPSWEPAPPWWTDPCCTDPGRRYGEITPESYIKKQQRRVKCPQTKPGNLYAERVPGKSKQNHARLTERESSKSMGLFPSKVCWPSCSAPSISNERDRKMKTILFQNSFHNHSLKRISPW